MFRVLSEEESKRVTRWQAPELTDADGKIVKTVQLARPQATRPDEPVRPLLKNNRSHSETMKGRTARPVLQPVRSTNVLAGGVNVQQVLPGGSGEVPAVSADMLQASYDEGYAKGCSDTREALEETYVKELKPVIAALKAATVRHKDVGLEQEILALTLDVAKLVIRREMTFDDKLILSIISAGLDQLPGGSDSPACVNLNPFDAAIVRRHVAEEDTFLVVDDPELQRGGCRIHYGKSVVNCGIDDWLALVSAQLGLTSTDTAPLYDPGKSSDSQAGKESES